MNNILVLSYNMSWATQINKVAGTESDFVKACQLKYKNGGKDCTNNAIHKIGQLPYLSLMGIQEINSDSEIKIQKKQPFLTKFERGKVGVSSVSILWDPNIFGKLKKKYIFNLVNDDDRPCLIMILKKKNQHFIIMNLHMPHKEKRDKAIDKINFEIKNNKILNDIFNKKNIKIIAIGDFNDSKTKISLRNPMMLKSKYKTFKLSYKLSRKQAKKTLKSCCWNKKKHKYFSKTGDYILVNQNIKQKYIKIPKIFKKTKKNIMASDHMPVLSSLLI